MFLRNSRYGLTPGAVSLVQKHAVLPGTSANYFSSSNAGEITSDWTIVAQLTMDDWTPAASKSICGQYNISGDQRNFLCDIISTGEMKGYCSVDGIAALSVDASAATGFTDGVQGIIRYRFDLDNGGANRAMYSDKWTGSWVAIGTSPATAAGVVASMFNSTAAITIGGLLDGATLLQPWSGQVKRIQAFNTLNSAGDPFDGATLLWDFNPNDWISGPNWVSRRTGETWTINGTASIVND